MASKCSQSKAKPPPPTLVKPQGMSIEDFCKKYKPSQCNAPSPLWLCVGQESVESGEWHEGLSKQAMDMLEDMKLKENTDDTAVNMKMVASSLDFTSGKWTVPVRSDEKIDILWEHVAKAFDKGVFETAIAVKVSTKSQLIDCGQYTLSIHTGDYTNDEAVYAIGSWLRNEGGVTDSMTYKPDIYTHLGVYFHNQWDLRPFLYTEKDLK